ncbi:MAG: hypothetical protein KGN16_26260, partial [Burkholderiales bacterium]|nr:hypothetical protein [Burkholderiales bacterium]
MRLQPAAIPSRIALLALASVLVTGVTGCSTIGGWFSSDQADYKKTPVRAQSLDVPPDLSQLARDSRYQVQGGVISAAAAASGPAAAAAPAAAASAAP